MKRQVLEILRLYPLPPALVVFVRGTVAGMRFDDIRVELGNLLATKK